ncbi:MAG TPA: sulfurtransferase [Steroidobacteraceae bacterium]|jgi:thiosulfate/3-mercaptopyruvate sulfurtransferase|nr:sulfurtransferase [Steroidobacteraceae bacterium]
MRHFTTLIDANTLSTQLSRDDLVLFDCRFDLGNVQWGETEYAAAHLPGALYLHLDRDLSGPITPSSGRHPLPDPAKLAQRLGELGVGADSQVIACDQGGNSAYAAHFWWLARWIGIRHVAVLDGGMTAWRAAGLPLENTVRKAQPRKLSGSVDAGAWLTSDEVDDLRRRPGNLLIDARSAERFAGRNETLDPIAGHVPGARSRPFTGNLAADGRFLPPEELRQRFATLLGSVPPTAIISMCGSGVTACHNLLALEHAGLTGARLYAGSWSEWIRDPRRAVATGSY